MKLKKIGFVKKLHGFKGWLLLKIDEDILVKWDKVECLFISIQGIPTPFFIEELEVEEKQFVLLENLYSEAEVRKFIGAEIFLNSDQLTLEKTKNSDYLVGNNLIDESFGELGEIIRIDSFPQHQVMVVIKDGKEILLPIQNEFITKEDLKNKIISYKAPEGLIEIYLS